MRKDLLPKQLRNITLIGFEPDDSDDDDKSKDDDDSDDDDEGDDKKQQGKTDDNDGLKSALQKERLERKRLAREAKAMKARLDEIDSKDKSETDKAKEDASKAQSRAEKLAQRLRDSAVDNVILKLSSGLKFRDADDALKLIDRSALDVEQDDEDPSEVEVDESSVKAALEALAKAKPHLIVAEGQEDKSGSKFGGGRKSTQATEDEAMRSKYPALGTAAPR